MRNRHWKLAAKLSAAELWTRQVLAVLVAVVIAT